MQTPFFPNTDGFKRFVALKDSHPKLKVLIGMGGWNERSKNFSVVAASSNLREKLATNVLKFLEEYKFDGIVISWDYPALRDTAHPKEDKVMKISCMLSLRIQRTFFRTILLNF